MNTQKHYTIPVFVPEVACPNRCVYCNQHAISGFLKAPSLNEVRKTIESHLQTIPKDNTFTEFGFFGGNFTGIPQALQIQYLETVNEYIKSGDIKAIRISTRPDYIDSSVLKMLKELNVLTIEVGLQSMSDEVLTASGRGHTAADTVKAAAMIKENGFRLGLQMMIGLPLDSFQRSFYTARKIAELQADDTRIYPTLVIKDTELEVLFKQKLYTPLSLNDAVDIVKEIYLFFEDHKINIIRVGLHPSDDLSYNAKLVAGPYHLSFRELVLSRIWYDVLSQSIDFKRARRIKIFVPIRQLNYAIGYNGVNKKFLLETFHKVSFAETPELILRQCHVDYY